MSLFGRNKYVAPTNDQIATRASDQAARALASFRDAAADLEDSANALDGVVVNAKSEAAKHDTLAENAAAEASNHRIVASKIKALVAPE